MFRFSLLWQDIVRLRTAISVAAVCGVYPGFYPVSHGQQTEVSLDLQAHRGGLGLITESTLQAFANALELGVTTLELDTQVTRDGYVVVTHDRQVLAHRRPAHRPHRGLATPRRRSTPTAGHNRRRCSG